MKYCSECGAPVILRVPEGDNLPRHVCEACGTVHYRNPKLVVGCIAEWEGKILLCRRAIQPRRGYWTVPAGFMENAETAEQAASRETLEEARARVEILAPLAMVSVPHINQVHLMFRGRLRNGQWSAGEETLEAVLADEHGIPWEEIAFPSVHYALERYFEDRRSGDFSFHVTDVSRIRF